MAITVPRPKLNWSERAYLPEIFRGMAITLRHFKNMLTGRTKVTMQYPEQKWDSHMPEHYRGAPTLVKDECGRVRCVACQLCEFICPPRAIRIVPEEVCPEQAIFLRKDYAITGYTREQMVHNKEKLIELGGTLHGLVLKWNEKK